MKTVYLHIGLNKAGSSTLRKFLFQNKKVFLSKGFLHLNTGVPEQASYGEHHNLAWFFENDRHDPSFGTWSDAHREIADSPLDKVIITSEFFSHLGRTSVEFLAKELSPYDVKIIVYLRRQDSRAISSYIQGVKEGSYHESVEKMWGYLALDADYKKKLSPWAEYFGSENIKVRPLEPGQVDDLCKDFLGILGLGEARVFQFVENQNIAPSQKVTEVLRFMNDVLIRRMRLSVQQCQCYKNRVINIFFEKWRFDEKNRAYSFISHQKRSELLRALEASDREVARKYLGRSDGILFYRRNEMPGSEAPSFAIDALSERDLEELMTCLADISPEKFKKEIREHLLGLLENRRINRKEKFRLFLLHLGRAILAPATPKHDALESGYHDNFLNEEQNLMTEASGDGSAWMGTFRRLLFSGQHFFLLGLTRAVHLLGCHLTEWYVKRIKFNAGWYLGRYVDVAASGMDPYEHYKRFGRSEGRDLAPKFSFERFFKKKRTGRKQGHKKKSVGGVWSLFLEFLRKARLVGGQSLGAQENFNAAGYLAHNPDVAASGMDPYEHYVRFGKAEGRIAPPLFSKRIPMALKDSAGDTSELPQDVAVHAHVLYTNLARELRAYLANMPLPYHFYVTTDTFQKAEQLKTVFGGMENVRKLDIRIAENRGRDVFPMIVTLGAELANHEIVLHVHTQRGFHDAWSLGGWRRYLLESLLGNARRARSILLEFIQNKKLGVLFPEPFSDAKPFLLKMNKVNVLNMKQLLSRAGKRPGDLAIIDRTFFPAGTMFWFRGAAIKPLVDLRLSAQEFEPEENPTSPGLAQAIERMFPYFAKEAGLVANAYYSHTCLSLEMNALPLDLFRGYVEKGHMMHSSLLFDHDVGGGTHVYARVLGESILARGGSILRVYNREGVWFVQWIANDDGMLFYTRSIETLFEMLACTQSADLIVNSFYGVPHVGEVIDRILKLVREAKIPMEIKVHDYFALCPSPHLSDYRKVYCGVPRDPAFCRRCLKKNKEWYVPWYPPQNRPQDILQWRSPFMRLLQEATTISFFDEAPIEVFRRGFQLDESKVRIVPHTDDYFKCDRQINLSGPLCVGILGRLTLIKGGGIVRSLFQYIERNCWDIPVVVVGEAYAKLPSRIKVHGGYQQNDLPNIISQYGINVIFMSSIWPETFSYTVSEAMKMGLPIVAFDLGAQGRRVKEYPLGKVIPLGSSPENILEALRSVHSIAMEAKR